MEQLPFAVGDDVPSSIQLLAWMLILNVQPSSQPHLTSLSCYLDYANEMFVWFLECYYFECFDCDVEHSLWLVEMHGSSSNLFEMISCSLILGNRVLETRPGPFFVGR